MRSNNLTSEVGVRYCRLASPKSQIADPKGPGLLPIPYQAR
jgi:hypothetical protein